MPELKADDRIYVVDEAGFLVDYATWSEAFAEEVAPTVRIPGPLNERHWAVIRTIQRFFERTGRCPVVYQVCREHRLRLADLGKLFPTGYLRGACRLAGLSYQTSYPPSGVLTQYRSMRPTGVAQELDDHGFLVDPESWDRAFAESCWRDLGHAGPLEEAHWRVIFFLRERFRRDGILPAVFETGEALGLEAPDMERLFPDGYNRGAVRMAGLAPGPRHRAP